MGWRVVSVDITQDLRRTDGSESGGFRQWTGHGPCYGRGLRFDSYVPTGDHSCPFRPHSEEVTFRHSSVMTPSFPFFVSPVFLGPPRSTGLHTFAGHLDSRDRVGGVEGPCTCPIEGCDSYWRG